MFILNGFSKEMGAFDHHPITLSPTTGMDVNRSKHKFKTEKTLSFQDIDFNHLMTHDESLAIIIKVKRHHQLCH